MLKVASVRQLFTQTGFGVNIWCQRHHLLQAVGGGVILEVQPCGSNRVF